MATELNVFDLLSAVESKNTTFFESLSIEQQKAFAPIVAQRWMTGNDDALQVYLVNSGINKYVFHLYREPNLLYQLMVACASGRKHKNDWIAKRQLKNTDIAVQAISQWLAISSKEATNVKNQYTIDDILEISDNLGWSKEEISKLKKALSTSHE